MEQKDIWSKLSGKYDIVKSIRNPCEYQREVAGYINSLLDEGRVIEVGAGTSAISANLKKGYRKTVLDINSNSIRLAAEAYKNLNIDAMFVLGDMFSICAAEKSFDIAFNAGVLEHYDFPERVAALKEMVRVVKSGGYIIIAIPNHYSTLYHLSYRYRVFRKKWKYPPEFKIFDLQQEADATGEVEFISRNTMAHLTAFYFIPSKLLRRFLLFIDRWIGFESYFTVITLRKK